MLFRASKQMSDTISIYSPCKGEQIMLEQVNDEIFASKMMGEGIAVYPNDDKIYAPIEAEIESIFPTKHALCLAHGNTQILIHIGINTVDLNGEGFHAHVKVHAHVKKGDVLITFDRKGLIAKGYDITVMLIVIDEQKKYNVLIENKKEITNKDVVLSIQKKSNIANRT